MGKEVVPKYHLPEVGDDVSNLSHSRLSFDSFHCNDNQGKERQANQVILMITGTMLPVKKGAPL
jgi:hypothetical protein